MKTENSERKIPSKSETEKNKKFTAKIEGESIPAANTEDLPKQTKLFNAGKTTSSPAGNAKTTSAKNVKAERPNEVKLDSSPATDVDHKYLGMNYHEYTRDELYQKAQEMDIDGRSQMSKEDLIKALYDNHTQEEVYEKASEANISGRSKMSKSELIKALRNRADNTPHISSGSNSKSNTSSGSTSSTSNKTTGTDYYKLNKEELYQKAQEKDIEGRSKMDKDELLDALYEDHTREELYDKAQKENIKGRSKMSKKELINELQKA